MLRGVALLAITGCDFVFPLGVVEPTGPCTTKMASLTDDFDGPQLQSIWTVDKSGMVTTGPAVNGTLFLDMKATGSIDVTAKEFFDLRDSPATVEVVVDAPDNPESMNVVEFELFATDTKHSLAWRLVGGNLVPGFFENGQFTAVHAAIPYNPPDHAVWGFARDRELTTWTLGTTVKTQIAIQDAMLPWSRLLQPRLTADRNDDQFTASFDKLDGGGDPAPACAASTLRDDFTEPEVDPLLWGRVSERDCDLALIGGQLTMVSKGTAFDCGLESGSIYDLVNHEVDLEVDIGQLSNNAATVFFEIRLLDGAFATFKVTNGDELIAQRHDPVTNLDELLLKQPYDPVAHKYWRFAGSVDDLGTGQIEWLVSADGQHYTQFKKFGGFAEVDRAGVNLGGFGGDVGTSVSFGGVNIRP